MSQQKRSNWIGYEPPYNTLRNPRAGFNAIYKSGSNNLYSYHVKYAVLGSPTAAMAHRMHVDNITALDYKDVVINKRQDLLLSSLIRNAGVDLSLFQFYAVHVNYKWNGNEFIPTEPTILAGEDVRINKDDDRGYYSKIFVSNWRDAKTKDKDLDWYYKYNPETSVILEQIRNDAKDADIDLDSDSGIEKALRNYRGQVRILNFTGEFPYPVPMIDSVLPDMLSEYYISLYTQGQTIDGFIAKTVAFIKSGTTEEDDEAINDMLDWLGTEGTRGIYVKEVKEVDDIEKIMKVVNFEGNYNDRMFEITEKRIRRNILQSFDNLPELLVYSGDGALFGTNPETWENAEKYYFKRTAYLREFLKHTLEDTLKVKLTLENEA